VEVPTLDLHQNNITKLIIYLITKIFQAMDRMEKSWRALRAASRRQILKPNQPTPLSPLASATLEAR
jgi:regulator of sirC expression with transglutaminase-like and TPR domain